MWKFVKRYVASCEVCARNKSSRHAPYGKLQPLPIPERAWQSLSMDFIVDLLRSARFNMIYVRLRRPSHKDGALHPNYHGGLRRIRRFRPLVLSSCMEASRIASRYCLRSGGTVPLQVHQMVTRDLRRQGKSLYLPPITLKQMAKPNGLIRRWNNTCGCTAIISRTTGTSSFLWPNLFITIWKTHRRRCHLSLLCTERTQSAPSLLWKNLSTPL